MSTDDKESIDVHISPFEVFHKQEDRLYIVLSVVIVSDMLYFMARWIEV